MSTEIRNKQFNRDSLSADCENCFGLCCVALPYAHSADFGMDKEAGQTCPNLKSDFRCNIHDKLRGSGFKGCAVYECFGAGQKVSLATYQGMSWRDNPSLAKEMFSVFPIMQQLHEMLYYLKEALHLQITKPFHEEIIIAIDKTEKLTNESPKLILDLDIPTHRLMVNKLLLQTSELVRKNNIGNYGLSEKGKTDYFGAKLRKADLRGANLRGAFLIAADLREADLRFADFIGADLRDTDISGADLTESIFLTQAQINAAIGDLNTKLPSLLSIPDHWR